MRSRMIARRLGAALLSFLLFFLVLTTFAPLGAEDRATLASTAEVDRPTPTPTATAPARSTATPEPLPEPSALEQATLDGRALVAGGWAFDGVALGVRTLGDARLAPEFELTRVDRAGQNPIVRRGLPALGIAGPGESALRLRDLDSGFYRWRARLVDAGGRTGPWKMFGSGDLGFQFVRRPPVVRGLTVGGGVPTSDGPFWIGESGRATLDWAVESEARDAVDRIVVLRERAEPSDSGATARADEPTWLRVLPAGSSTLDVDDLSDGRWRLSVWAVDKAGQVGGATSVLVAVQREPPRLTSLTYRTVAANPLYTPTRLRFAVSHSALASITLAAKGADSPLRSYRLGRIEPGPEVSVEWDGRNERGEVVPPGSYRFLVDLVDDAGNQSQSWHDGLVITDKVVRVSLANQSLVASAGANGFVSTLVTTGGRELPTRPGRFEVELKGSPFTFHAPFAAGSRYWYPPTTVRYAMLFDPDEGNFLHDNGSRTVFGPGTNGSGLPGGPYSGSHGCVNVPRAVMAALFEWTPLGAPVIVEP